MKIVIRNEQDKDFSKTEQLARDAFWNVYIPGAYEHYIIHTMRQHEDYIKGLAFVIEVDGEVAGAIYYTYSKIVNDTDEFLTVTFGPVFIAPAFQRRGLGRMLIEHSIQAAKAMGFQAVMILGYWEEYSKYGFQRGKKYGVAMPDGNFYKGLLLLPLAEFNLVGGRGIAVFSKVLEPSMTEVEKYDKNFDYKEKLVLASQQRFAEACQALDA